MSLHTRHALACLVAVGFAGACGGKVVFEGGGGSGGLGGSGGTTSHASSVGDTGGGGAGPELCTDFCAAQKAAGCDAGDCETRCELLPSYYGVCKDLVTALTECVLQEGFSSANCAEVPPGCQDLANKLTDCAYPPGDCGVGQCSAESDGLHCTRECGDVGYATSCTNGHPSTCTCTRGDQTLGTCSDEIDSFGDCCIAFFASAG